MEDAAGEVREAERVLADTEDATRVVAGMAFPHAFTEDLTVLFTRA